MTQPPGTPILQGVVGSTAYGLATEQSDQDFLGAYVAPIDEVLGLDVAQVVTTSLNTNDPDTTWHELGKYVGLALKSNPTVLELLWLPTYTQETEIGTALVTQRQYFLSESGVRGAYGGYAREQARRLLQREAEGKQGFSSDVKNRTKKHGRHCFRLLLQGQHLLKTGEIMIDVSQYRDFLFEVGEIAAASPERFYGAFEELLTEFEWVESCLPQCPDRDKINAFLVKARKEAL